MQASYIWLKFIISKLCARYGNVTQNQSVPAAYLDTMLQQISINRSLVQTHKLDILPIMKVNQEKNKS